MEGYGLIWLYGLISILLDGGDLVTSHQILVKLMRLSIYTSPLKRLSGKLNGRQN